jgi:hypothetical protein
MIGVSDLRLKQGATLLLDLLITDDLDQPIDLSAAAVAIQVSDLLGNSMARLPVTPGAQQGWGTVAAATTGWPVGILNAEVQLSAAGLTQISDTFTLTIERPVAS